MTETLNGSLTNLGELMAANLQNKGVSDASAQDGLTTLANKISDINLFNEFKLESDVINVGVGDEVTFTATLKPYSVGNTVELYKDDVFVANMTDKQDGTYEYKITMSEQGTSIFKAKYDDKYTNEITINTGDITHLTLLLSKTRNDIVKLIQYVYDGDKISVNGKLTISSGVELENKEIKIYFDDELINSGVTNSNGEYNIDIILPYRSTNKIDTELQVKAVFEGDNIDLGSIAQEKITYRKISDADYTSFTYLQSLINKAKDNEVFLTHDYTYDNNIDNSTGITLTNDITINGQSKNINCQESARAFNISSANIIINDLYLNNAKQQNKGGAIYHNGGTLELNNCRFYNCKAVDNNENYFEGGAIWSNSTILKINKSNFEYCEGDEGGAIYYANINGYSNIQVSNSKFRDNKAIRRAGALLCISNKIEFDENVFTHNECGTHGGAVLTQLLTVHSARIYNCEFNQNIAPNYGGAVYIFDGSGSGGYIFDECVFDNNGAEVGGAIFSRYEINVSNSRFTNNIATDYGGVIYISNESYNISGSLFANNNARRLSSVIHTQNNSGTVIHSIIINNGSLPVFYCANSSIIVDENWWGSNEQNKNTRPFSITGVTLTRWTYLITRSSETTKKIGETDTILAGFTKLTDGSVESEFPYANELPNIDFDVSATKATLNRNKVNVKGANSDILNVICNELGTAEIRFLRDNITYSTNEILINDE